MVATTATRVAMVRERGGRNGAPLDPRATFFSANPPPHTASPPPRRPPATPPAPVAAAGDDAPPPWIALLRPPFASPSAPPPRGKGVTRHAVTQRYEAHLWDSSAHRPTEAAAPASSGGKPTRARGRQVYLGGFECSASAARAYDVARLAYRGPSPLTADTTTTGRGGLGLNYPAADYAPHAPAIWGAPREAVVASLKRASAGFSRGASVFRGVGAAPMDAPGRWEARVGRVAGARYTHIGRCGCVGWVREREEKNIVVFSTLTFPLFPLPGYYATELEAARAYDAAVLAIKGASVSVWSGGGRGGAGGKFWVW